MFFHGNVLLHLGCRWRPQWPRNNFYVSRLRQWNPVYIILKALRSIRPPSKQSKQSASGLSQCSMDLTDLGLRYAHVEVWISHGPCPDELKAKVVGLIPLTEAHQHPISNWIAGDRRAFCPPAYCLAERAKPKTRFSPKCFRDVGNSTCATVRE